MEQTIKYKQTFPCGDIVDINIHTEDQFTGICKSIFYIENDGTTIHEFDEFAVEVSQLKKERMFNMHPNDNPRFKIHPLSGRYMYLDINNHVINF